MKIKVIIALIGGAVIFSLLDHFFFVSEYLEQSLQAVLLVVGVLLILSGGLGIFNSSTKKPQDLVPYLLRLLAGGAAISPGGLTALSLAALIIAYWWLSKDKLVEEEEAGDNNKPT